MINAGEAKASTRESWFKYVDDLINLAADNHLDSTKGIKDLPRFIQDDLISRGFKISTTYEEYYYINWGEER